MAHGVKSPTVTQPHSLHSNTHTHTCFGGSTFLYSVLQAVVHADARRRPKHRTSLVLGEGHKVAARGASLGKVLDCLLRCADGKSCQHSYIWCACKEQSSVGSHLVC